MGYVDFGYRTCVTILVLNRVWVEGFGALLAGTLWGTPGTVFVLGKGSGVLDVLGTWTYGQGHFLVVQPDVLDGGLVRGTHFGKEIVFSFWGIWLDSGH